MLKLCNLIKYFCACDATCKLSHNHQRVQIKLRHTPCSTNPRLRSPPTPTPVPAYLRRRSGYHKVPRYTSPIPLSILGQAQQKQLVLLLCPWHALFPLRLRVAPFSVGLVLLSSLRVAVRPLSRLLLLVVVRQGNLQRGGRPARQPVSQSVARSMRATTTTTAPSRLPFQLLYY